MGTWYQLQHTGGGSSFRFQASVRKQNLWGRADLAICFLPFPGTCGRSCDFLTVKWEEKCLYQKVVWHAPVLWEQGKAFLTPFVNGDINVNLCCDKTFPGQTKCAFLLSPDREPMTDQSSDATNLVQLSEPGNFIGATCRNMCWGLLWSRNDSRTAASPRTAAWMATHKSWEPAARCAARLAGNSTGWRVSFLSVSIGLNLF